MKPFVCLPVTLFDWV